MTQIKTTKHLKTQEVQCAEDIWMAAAAKTIHEANLSEAFEANYKLCAHKRGRDNILQDLTSVQLPPRAAC